MTTIHRTKSTPGPKPGPASMRRSVRIVAVVTPGEGRAIAAAARGRSVSDWARTALVAAAGQPLDKAGQ